MSFGIIFFNLVILSLDWEVIMKTLQKICLVFTIIGALNWGLIGLFDLNLVYSLFKFSEMLQNIIYIIVGICGLVNIGLLFMDIHYEKMD